MDEIFIDISDNGVFLQIVNMRLNNVFTVKQNDTLPSLVVGIKTRGVMDEVIPFNLSAVTACTFSMIDGFGNLAISSSSASTLCASGGTIEYEWLSDDTTQSGKFLGEFELSFSGGTQMTVPTTGGIEIQVIKRIGA